MKTVVKQKYAVKPLVAAVALACTTYNAYAVTANQMPGAGLVTAVSAGATVNGLTTGGAIVNLVSSPTAAQVSLAGAVAPRVVIQWGGTGTGGLGETKNPPGFNVGTGASLNFETAGGFGIGAVLNVDASGSISQILGTVRGDTIAAGSNGFTQIFVANANGITVGPDARIIAPYGVGLLGADMTGATAKYEFTRQNGAGVSFVDVTTGQSDVIVGGVINGDAVANVPATFVLLIGGNVTNTGNIFGAQVGVAAGMRASPTTDTVNLVAKTTVNRIWRLDSAAPFGSPTTTANLGVFPGLEIASATSSFVNTGAISSSSTNAVTGVPSYIGVSAANSIRSGTLGDTSQLVGLYSDGGVLTNTYSATGKTELYNVVEAYTIGNTLPFLDVNQATKAAGDVVINTLIAGANPSSITTTGPVNIYGGNVQIDSTINHKLNSAGGKQLDSDLNIVGSKSVTITKDIGAGADILICAGDVGCFTGAGGPITISGNVLSDTDSAGNGGIYVVNYGTQGGNTTTISGNLSTAKSSFDGIFIENYGINSSKVNISGTITTHHSQDVGIYSKGGLDFSGTILASGNAMVTVLGTAPVLLRGPITADAEGLNGESFVSLATPLATTKIYPAAVLTAPAVLLGYDWFTGDWIGVNNVSGVDATGAPYATAKDKPAAQIVTNNLVLMSRGNFNAPIAGNTDWLQNQLQVEAQDATLPINVSVSAVGAGFQAINMGFKGDVVIDSGSTITPFANIPLSTGTLGGGALIGNGGSQLIVNASGNLSITDDSGAQHVTYAGGPGFTGNHLFEFPGGVAFKAGGVLSQFVPVYNAWTTVAQAYQGIFFEAPTIQALSYQATNGNSFVNYSVLPSAGVPPVYQIAQNPPTGVALGFGFLPAPLAPHLNTYSKLITGTPVNTCPIGFVC